MNPMKAVPFLALLLSGCLPSGGGDSPAPAKPKVGEGQLKTARAEVAAAEAQGRYRALLEKEVLKLQSPDGCWWDYPMQGYAKPYGTAFALLALAP